MANPNQDWDTLFANAPWRTVVGYMARHPDDAPSIYRWGQTQPTIWPGRVGRDFLDHFDLTRWHDAMYNAEHNITTGMPVAFIVRTPVQYLRRTIRPIGWLIRHDCADALRELYNSNLWDPLSYNATGLSHFTIALTNNAFGVTELIFRILRHEQRPRLFARKWQTIQAITGFNTPGTHFDLLLQYARYDLFIELWRLCRVQAGAPNLNAAHELFPQSKEKLLRYVDKRTAQMLLTGGLNLAAVRIRYTRERTKWHVAVEHNSNYDFLEFLARNSPNAAAAAEIEAHGSYGVTPLQLAFARHKLEHFEELLELGADPGPVTAAILANFPCQKDEYLLGVLPHVRNPGTPANARVEGGTLLHVIVQALHTSMWNLSNTVGLTRRQRTNERVRRMARAKALVQLVKRGNVRGVPDLSTMDQAGRTARELAEAFGFRALYRLL